jgi:pimeloyl-ACP methyl ester carboxylesterase
MVPLFAKEYGAGKTLLFIHGFPMHQQVWEDFILPFVKNYHVITLDLPGFGKSPGLQSPFSLDDVADQILTFIDEKELHDIAVIGHSLGGYVALAMIAKEPDAFSSICLFHSTALADSREKKESRDKVIEFVEKNGSEAFTTNFIAPLFADANNASIEHVKDIAKQSSAEAVMGYTLAMRDRTDKRDVLRDFQKPSLFIVGNRDQGIPVESIHQQVVACNFSEMHILDQVGHMGMYENPGESAIEIMAFLAKI